MRVVNLSRRPFLNRRPVVRVATLLWVVGGLLLLLNVWLFADYLSGTTKNRERLAELGAEIDAAEREFDQMAQRLSQVSLGERNQRAAFLNELIDQRTFPWSRLFDDLEDAMHEDVYLTLVAPSVEGEENRTSSSRSSSRRMTPREARERARRQRSGGGSGNTSGGPASMPTPESANVDERPDFDVVSLTLQGTARSGDALLEFVDALYQNKSFIDPFLSLEQRNEEQRGTVFAITTYYLLPRRIDRLNESDDVLAEGGGLAEPGSTANDTDDDGARPPDEQVAESLDGEPDRESGSEEVDGPPTDTRADARTDVRADSRVDSRVESPSLKRPEPTNEEDLSRDPVVRTPGQPIDRRRPSERRDRSDFNSIDDLRNDDSTPPEDDAEASPTLTEPGASASPRLRRVGSLDAPSPPGSGPARAKEARS